MNTNEIRIADYDYPLPDERIAKFPLPQRDHSKLLLYRSGRLGEDTFCNLPRYIAPGTLMVFNNTRVIQARLHFRKETGALIEVFCLEPAEPADYQLSFQQCGQCSWYCLVGNAHKWKSGRLTRRVTVQGRQVAFSAERGEAHLSGCRVNFFWDDESVTFAELLDAVGELPIPPYLNRKSQESDKLTYQTVYSAVKGSVAAPTAGLHFTPQTLQQLRDGGIDCCNVTLHVGAGTFKPVKSDTIEEHTMHSEFIVVDRSLIEKLIAKGGAVAVGTTSVRTLESLYYVGEKLAQNPDATEEQLHVEQWTPYNAPHTLTTQEALQLIVDYLRRHGLEQLHTSTQIIIAPGYRFRVVKAMVTNFHQPRSTLLLLVSAFVGGNWRAIYDYALGNGFRFLSYGDSSLLVP